MKNFKKVLSLVLALSMILSTMTLSFAAADTTAAKADVLNALGLLKGVSTEEFDPALDVEANRQTAMVLLARAFGWELDEEAVSEFSDVADWAQAEVAYAVELGVTNGMGEEFGATTMVTERMVTTWVVRLLTGSETAWEDNAELDNKDAVDRGFLVDAIWAALSETPVGAEETLIASIIGEDADLLAIAQEAGLVEVVVEPATLAVESVTALNLKEIEVVFNKDAEAGKSNFLINGAAPTDEQIKISEDGKTVNLFVPSNLTANTKVAVVISGLADLGTAKFDVPLNDNALPVVEKVETIGNRLVVVTFSEPMNLGTESLANFKIDGKIVSLTTSKPNSDFHKVVRLQLSAPLADGTYSLEVNASNVKDYAGNAIGVNATSFVIAKETAVPTATVVSATQQTVEVKFEREPSSVAKLYHKVGDTKVESVANGVQDVKDKTLYKFTFTDANRIPAGSATLYLAEVKDFSGNTAKDVAIGASVVVDLERPEFVSLTQVDETTFDVKFTKAVVIAASNITIKDNAGVSYVAGTPVVRPDGVTYRFNVTLNTSRNPYTFEFKGITDTTYLKNQAVDVKETIVIADKTAPTVLSVVRDVNKLSVVLSESHNGNVTVANFKYTLNGTTFRDMPAGTYLEFVGTTAVNLVLPNVWTIDGSDRSAASITHLNVASIADVAGNVIVAVNTAISAATAPQVTSVYMYDKNTLVAEVNGTLTDVWAGDFVVTAGSATLTVTNAKLVVADEDVNKYALASGRAVAMTDQAQLVVLTVEQNLNGDAKYTVLGVPTAVVVRAATSVQVTKNALGQSLVLNNVTVDDNAMIASLSATNFTLATTGAVTVKNTFVTDEAVEIETYKRVFVQGADAPLVTVVATQSGVTGTTFAAATAIVAGIANNEEVFVRVIDTAGNRSAWINLGTTAAAKVADAELEIDRAVADNTAAKLATASTAAAAADTAVATLVAGAYKTSLADKMTAAKAKITTSVANIELTKVDADTVGATWGSDDQALLASTLTFATSFDAGKGVTAVSVDSNGDVTATTNATDTVNFVITAKHTVFTGANATNSKTGSVATGGVVVAIN